MRSLVESDPMLGVSTPVAPGSTSNTAGGDLRNRDLWVMMLLTFILSWGAPGALFLLSRLGWIGPLEFRMYSPLYYAAVWAPAFAGVAVVRWRCGARGLRRFLSRLMIWRIGVGWYALVFVGVPALYLTAAVLTTMAGEPALIPFGAWTLWLGETLRRATAGPVEELGWRGVALPLLQRRMTGLRASVVLGVIWGAWHLPAFAIGALEHGTLAGAGLVALFVAQTVAVSVIASIMFNATRGSLLLAMLLHWMTNIPYPWEGPADAFAIQAVLLTVGAAIMAIVFRARYLGQRGLITEVACRSSLERR